MGEDITNAKPLSFDEFALAMKKAAEVYQERFFVVVGRGSLSVSMPEASAALRTTGDIDLFAPHNPDRLDAWSAADALVSVESPFFVEHGFYIERVGEWTLLSQPAGWQTRALQMRIDDIDLLILHPLDLAYNKLEAGRSKDIEFMAEGIRSGAYDVTEVRTFIEVNAPDVESRNLVLDALKSAIASI